MCFATELIVKYDCLSASLKKEEDKSWFSEQKNNNFKVKPIVLFYLDKLKFLVEESKYKTARKRNALDTYHHTITLYSKTDFNWPLLIWLQI